MRYSAVLSFLIIYLNTVHADSNQDSPFSIGDVSTDGLIGHHDAYGNPFISASWEDKRVKKLLPRHYGSQQWQQRDTKLISLDNQLENPAWGFLAFKEHTRLSGSNSSRLATRTNSKNPMLQEDSIRLHARNPARRPTRDSTSSQSSHESRSVSPQSQQRGDLPSPQDSQRQPQLRTSALSNVLQQQRVSALRSAQQQQPQPGRRRVHVLQPLTDETVHAMGSFEGISSRADSRRASEIFSPSLTRRRQQQLQLDLQRPSPHLEFPQNNGGMSTSSPQNRSGHIHNGAQAPSSSPKQNSPPSLDEGSEHRSASLDSTKHKPEVQSRSTNRGNRLRNVSQAQLRSRRRQREEHDETTPSTVALRRLNEDQNDGVTIDGLTRTSSEEGEPSTQRRRLSKRGNIVTKISPRRKLPTRLIKNASEGRNSGSQLQTSLSVSSSGGSLRTSKSQRRKAAKAAKTAKTAASSSGDLTNQGASSSQTQEQSTKGRKSRQKSAPQPSSSSPSGPKRGTAYLYGRPKPNRRQEIKDPILDRVRSQGSPSRSSSTASFGTAISKSSDKNLAPGSPSGSSSKSFFSAKSDGSVSPVGSPRSSFASAEQPSLQAYNTGTSSPKLGVSFADQSSPRTGGIDIGSRASSAASFSTQLSRGFLMPTTPFANIKPANTQSLPGSPSTHYRPSYFGNAHSRSYSAPELTVGNPQRTSSLANEAESSALLSRKASSSTTAFSPKTQEPWPGSPTSPLSNVRSQDLSPFRQASATSERAPISRQGSAGSNRLSTYGQSIAGSDHTSTSRQSSARSDHVPESSEVLTSSDRTPYVRPIRPRPFPPPPPPPRRLIPQPPTPLTPRPPTPLTPQPSSLSSPSLPLSSLLPLPVPSSALPLPPPDSPSTPKAQIQRQGIEEAFPASPQLQQEQGVNMPGGLDPVIARPRVSKYGPVGSPVRGSLAADTSKGPSYTKSR